VEAGVAVPVVVALVHIDVAVRSVEALSAGAPVPVGEGLAGRSVATGLRRAVVRLLTCFTFPSERAGAGVSAEGGEVAAAPVPAGAGVAHVLYGHLAQRGAEPDRTRTLECRRLVV